MQCASWGIAPCGSGRKRSSPTAFCKFTATGAPDTTFGPGGVKTNFAIGTGRTEGDPVLDVMLTADEVADVVLFTVTRPGRMRILTTSFRPMIEASWG